MTDAEKQALILAKLKEPGGREALGRSMAGFILDTLRSPGRPRLPVEQVPDEVLDQHHADQHQVGQETWRGYPLGALHED